MDRFLYKILFITSLAFCSDVFAESLEGKTITMTNKDTGKNPKPLIVKLRDRQITIAPNKAIIFDLIDIMDLDAKVHYQGSKYTRSLDLDPITLALKRSTSKNVNIDLIPGATYGAKIANPIYGPPTKNAVREF